MTFFRTIWFHIRRLVADKTGLIAKPLTIHEYARKHLDEMGCRRYGAGLTYQQAQAKYLGA